VSDLDFLSDLIRMTPEQQSRFQRVISRLLGGSVITPGDNPLAPPDPDWRFLERNLRLVNGYLETAGWMVEYRPEFRMARAVHKERQHRVRFNLLESLLLCVLRLSYHEQMGGDLRDEAIEITTGDLRELVTQAQRSSTPLPRGKLKQALAKLKRHDIIDYPWGYQAEDNESIQILPMVELVLSTDAVQRFYDRYADPSLANPTEQEEMEDLDEMDAEIDDLEEAPQTSKSTGYVVSSIYREVTSDD
jgi:hypothetical protein